MQTDDINLEDVDISDAFSGNMSRKLIVHNDDVTTFNTVIRALVQVCNHTFEQAEQCAMIIHHNGKCSVKTGGYDDLKPLKDQIQNYKIQVTIE